MEHVTIKTIDCPTLHACAKCGSLQHSGVLICVCGGMVTSQLSTTNSGTVQSLDAEVSDD